MTKRQAQIIALSTAVACIGLIAYGWIKSRSNPPAAAPSIHDVTLHWSLPADYNVTGKIVFIGYADGYGEHWDARDPLCTPTCTKSQCECTLRDVPTSSLAWTVSLEGADVVGPIDEPPSTFKPVVCVSGVECVPDSICLTAEETLLVCRQRTFQPF